MNEEKKSFLQKLSKGLSRTRDSFVRRLQSVFLGVEVIDEDFYEQLEETLIVSDIGVQTTEEILDELKEIVDEKHLISPLDCQKELREVLRNKFLSRESDYDFEKQPAVLFLMGVNGVGKTTTAGKLAAYYKKKGKKVLLSACDTFRAAAIEQLNIWSKRADVPIILSEPSQDPSAVLFDSIQSAKKHHTDLLICDTAGRLHNKTNLMEELRKMNRVIEKEYPDSIRKNILILDATTGQNGVKQAEEFSAVCPIDGLILTKMDGTAKGGIVFPIVRELKIPVLFVGLGESIDDLEKFYGETFVEALFEE